MFNHTININDQVNSNLENNLSLDLIYLRKCRNLAEKIFNSENLEFKDNGGGSTGNNKNSFSFYLFEFCEKNGIKRDLIIDSSYENQKILICAYYDCESSIIEKILTEIRKI